MGLLDKIKNDVKKSGTNKGKLMYFREGVKTRIRFLNDMDDGMEIVFHDNYAKNINVPCQEVFGRNCPYCDEDADVRTRSLYAWSVWDYDAKEVKVFLFAVNNCSPIPALMAMYENYGTLTDRDYVITVNGRQKDKSYAVIPQDKARFRNDKAKPLSESAILKIIDKAYPFDDEDAGDDDDYEEEDEKPRRSTSKAKKSAAKSGSVKSKGKASKDDEDEWEDEAEEEENDYSNKTPKELYVECRDRGLHVATRKPAAYYINQLKEYDAAHDDWEDEDEDDESDWEDEDDE